MKNNKTLKKGIATLKLEKTINKGASGLTPREKAESFFVLLLPVAYWLMHMLIGLGMIGLLVFICSSI